MAALPRVATKLACAWAFVLAVVVGTLSVPTSAHAEGSIFLESNCWNSGVWGTAIKPYARPSKQWPEGCFDTPLDVVNANCRLSLALGHAETCELYQAPAALTDITQTTTGVNHAKGGTQGENYMSVPVGWFGLCPEHSVSKGGLECGCNAGFGPGGEDGKQCVPVSVVSQANTAPCNCKSDPLVANPISPLRGVKRETVGLGVQLAGLPLALTYDSSDLVPRTPAESNDGAGAEILAPQFGRPGWHGTLWRHLSTAAGAEDGAVIAHVTRGDGTVDIFKRQGSGPYASASGSANRLQTDAAGGLRLDDVRANAQEIYDGAGRLSQIAWIDGRRLTLSYGSGATQDKPVGASDGHGRTLGIEYNADPRKYGLGLPSRFTDPAGAVSTLEYGGYTTLDQLNWPDGTSRRFLYQAANLVSALTGIVDEAGVQYASFGYDSTGLAISSEHAGGVGRYATSYGTPPGMQAVSTPGRAVSQRTWRWTAPQDVVVTQPNGATQRWSAIRVNGHNALQSREQPAGSGSAAATSAQTYDDKGNLTSRDDFNGIRSCFQNDEARNLETARVEGLGTQAACSSATAITAVLPAGARKTTTEWHPQWSLRSKVAEPGQITTNVYNGQPDPSAGNAIAACAPASATLPDGKPIAVLCKQLTQSTTDTDGHLGFSASAQPGSPVRVTRWTYNQDGQVLTVRGTRADLDDSFSFSYYADTNENHTHGDLQSITDAKGKVTTFDKYNRYGQVLQSTDPNGIVTVNGYDARQRLTSRTVGSETTTYTYDPVGQLTRVTQHNGSWVGFEYDAAHRRTASTDSDGNRIEDTLDNAGQSTGQTVRDPQGALAARVARVLDALGRLQQQTRPGEGSLYGSWQGTSAGTWIALTSEGQGFQAPQETSQAWRVRYGADTRWIEREVNGEGSCSNAFFGADPAPGVVKSCQRYAASASPAGWNTLATEGQSFEATRVWRVRYGVDTRWIEREVVGLTPCTYVFFGGDPAPGVSKSCQRYDSAASAPPTASAAVERYEYDAEGNPTRQTQSPDGLNLQTQLAYDALERVKESTDPAGYRTSLQYDGADRLTQVTDPRNLSTQYVRNGFGEMTQLSSPDTGTATRTFDEAGNLKTRSDSRGVLESYSYDALNRLTTAVYSQGGQTSQTLSWGWDMTGPGYSNGLDRLGRTDHPNGSARWQYDPLGRVTQATQTVNASANANPATVTTTVQYGYTLGRLTSITYPSGRQVGIAYGGRRIGALSLAQSAGGPTTPLLSDVRWEPFGSWRGWKWAMAGTVPDIAQRQERYSDQGGRLVRYRLGENYRDVGYDAAMRITGFTHLSANDGSSQAALDQVFSYDANSRLTLIATANSTWSIAYDANGNRTGVSLNGEPSTYTTEATSNRLTAISNPVRSFGYDSAGSTTSDSGNYTATYNLRGQLETITTAAGTATYTYDADGRRVRKVTSAGPASTVIFVYDLDGQLLGEYDQAGNAIREYVWLEHTPVAMFMPDPVNPSGAPLVFFIHTDHLDAPRIVVDRNNQVRWRWLAEPFGATAPETNPLGLGVFTQNLRFPGQYADAESGLWYNYFRNYDRSIGRYTQSDPIGLRGGLNTYAYVGGNPLGFVDPLGLYTEVVYWHGVGVGESQFGHISTNINGKNFSWGPPGQWDTKYPRASDYNARQQTFRDGSGVVLNLTPDQEKALAACMSASSGEYSLSSNNCGTSVQDCLQKVGVQFDKALRPSAIFDSLRRSPSAIGSTFYPGPPRDGGPLENPSVWGF